MAAAGGAGYVQTESKSANPIQKVTRAFWTGVDVVSLFFKTLVNPQALEQRHHPTVRSDRIPISAASAARPSPFNGPGQRLGGGGSNIRGVARPPSGLGMGAGGS